MGSEVLVLLTGNANDTTVETPNCPREAAVVSLGHWGAMHQLLEVARSVAFLERAIALDLYTFRLASVKVDLAWAALCRIASTSAPAGA